MIEDSPSRGDDPQAEAAQGILDSEGRLDPRKIKKLNDQMTKVKRLFDKVRDRAQTESRHLDNLTAAGNAGGLLSCLAWYGSFIAGTGTAKAPWILFAIALCFFVGLAACYVRSYARDSASWESHDLLWDEFTVIVQPLKPFTPEITESPMDMDRRRASEWLHKWWKKVAVWSRLASGLGLSSGSGLGIYALYSLTDFG